MLFNLVDAGVLALDVAAGFAGMSVEEADDMLQGWITAQQMPGGFLPNNKKIIFCFMICRPLHWVDACKQHLVILGRNSGTVISDSI